MSRKNKLDKALLVFGYFIATFILVVSTVGIILAMIKMFEDEDTILELPQSQADEQKLLEGDASVTWPQSSKK